MAVYKCKACGGTLNPNDGDSVVTCEYCGVKQTLQSADNEKKNTLFARADKFLKDCEFDKASVIYESIVEEFPKEAEAYWDLLLCKYGIEYVDDPNTGNKVITCHRTETKSIFDEDDYKQAIKLSDVIAKEARANVAKDIDRIQQEILKFSNRMDPYDIFICFKDTNKQKERTEDSVIAEEIYDALTAKGYRVFFSRVTLDDILGIDYEPYIFSALSSASILIHVTTSVENTESIWVKNEWSRFLRFKKENNEKVIFNVYKNVEPEDLPTELNRLQSVDYKKIGAKQDILRGVEKILNRGPVVRQDRYSAANDVSKVQGDEREYDVLIEKAYRFLEIANYDKAEKAFENAIGLVEKCGDGYLGMLLVESKFRGIEDAIDRADSVFISHNMFAMAKKYASTKLSNELTKIEKEVNRKANIADLEIVKSQINDLPSDYHLFRLIKLIIEKIESLKDNEEGKQALKEYQSLLTDCLQRYSAFGLNSNQLRQIITIRKDLDTIANDYVAKNVLKQLEEHAEEVFNAWETKIVNHLKIDKASIESQLDKSNFECIKFLAPLYQKIQVIIHSTSPVTPAIDEAFKDSEEFLRKKLSAAILNDKTMSDNEVGECLYIMKTFNYLYTFENEIKALNFRSKHADVALSKKEKRHSFFKVFFATVLFFLFLGLGILIPYLIYTL